MPGPAPAASRPNRRQFGALVAGTVISAHAASSSARAEPIRPSRGFNVPGWVDHEDGIAPTRPVLEKLRATGFDTIRLPVAADPILGRGDTPSTALRRIGDALALCEATGFSVVLDLHPSGRFGATLRASPGEGSALAQEAWRKLADVMAVFPATFVQAELLNEPPMEQATWLDLRDTLAGIVRQACPFHGIVWGPARFQGIWELHGTRPLADARASVAIHYYAPMAFTHQCENWDGSALGRVSGVPFPATADTPAVAELAAKLRQAGDTEALKLVEDAFARPWDADRIAADFAELAAWAKQHDCPALLGEFGVLDFCADTASRANWTRAVCRAAEANGVGWTYWELDQGFGFIKSRRSVEGFDPALLAAMTDADRP